MEKALPALPFYRARVARDEGIVGRPWRGGGFERGRDGRKERGKTWGEWGG